MSKPWLFALKLVASGTQSLHTNALDEAIALPTEFSARIARNTQLILQEETGVSNVVDPLAGSYYVESLTSELADAAWNIIQEIDEMGGMTKAIEKGYPNEEDQVETTTLNGSRSSSVTTLTLTSTTGFASSGKVYIGGEQVTYTAVSGNDITGCTRGANSTTAALHADGTTVTQFDNGGVPRNIVRTPDNNYLLYPYPDKQYALVFDYFTFPSDLSAHGDTTSIPDRFGPVIVDGATAFVYQYRGETQQYQLNMQRFEQGIKNMQTLLVNKFLYLRSTFIPRTGVYNSGSVDIRAL